MVYDRRTFLKKTAASLTATGLSSIGLFEMDVFASPKSGQSTLFMNDEERRKLIYEAHFGPKTPAQSQNGMICACGDPRRCSKAEGL